MLSDDRLSKAFLRFASYAVATQWRGRAALDRAALREQDTTYAVADKAPVALTVCAFMLRHSVDDMEPRVYLAEP